MQSTSFTEENPMKRLESHTDHPGEEPGIWDDILIFSSYFFVVCTLPLSLFMCFRVVREYERAVIFRLGRLTKGGPRGPGLFLILPCTGPTSGSEVLTKDSVTVSVDAVVYYRVTNPIAAILNVANFTTSTRLLAATTLRTVLGTKNLSEILSEREQISHIMEASLDDATDPWGVKVERIEIKDVSLPEQMQRAMAAEAEASRDANAKVIAAQGEQNASRALKEAADIIALSPAALQLRYLQTLTSIAAENNSTIVFPLPMDILRGMGITNV